MSESIVKNELRVGRFTSSEIYKLIPFGTRDMTELELIDHKASFPKSKKKTISIDGFTKAGETYIKERIQERKRKRSLSVDAGSQATAFGSFMEMRIFDLLEDLRYIYMSSNTMAHPKYGEYWSGTVDFLIQCFESSEAKAFQPKGFCDYADCLLQKDVDLFRVDFPKEYWQIVSNACIHDTPKGEALLYNPYDSEAPAILEMLESYDEPDIWKYKFISDYILDGSLHKLPFQPDDSEYPNLVRFQFDIPQEDKDFLTERVEEAVILLEKGLKK